MKRTLFMIVGLLLVAGGCNQTEWPRERRLTMNRWMVNEYHRDSIRAGVVSQHTLYPHHFEANSGALNELGRRDVGILADYYATNPGLLNVRRASASGEIYKQRVQTVNLALADAGVDMKRVRVTDLDAGGDGLESERVLMILTERMDEPLSNEDRDSGAVFIND